MINDDVLSCLYEIIEQVKNNEVAVEKFSMTAGIKEDTSSEEGWKKYQLTGEEVIEIKVRRMEKDDNGEDIDLTEDGFKNQIAKYVMDKITLAELRDYYLPYYPYFSHFKAGMRSDIIGEIELALVEIENKRITEEDLKEKLMLKMFKIKKGE